jgi:hypothetical protein
MKKEIQSKEEAIESVMYGNKHDYHSIFTFAEVWVRKQFKWFSADDLKEAYFENGGRVPDEPRVIGAVFRDLSKSKLIFPIGYTTSKNKVAHGRPLRTWISLQFKQRQANNASNKSNLKLEL